MLHKCHFTISESPIFSDCDLCREEYHEEIVICFHYPYSSIQTEINKHRDYEEDSNISFFNETEDHFQNVEAAMKIRMKLNNRQILKHIASFETNIILEKTPL